MSGSVLHGILAGRVCIGLGWLHRPPVGQALEPVAVAGVEVPKDQWQCAIGHRLLTPAEEAARLRYFLGQFTAAMRRFAVSGRRTRSHPFAA